MYICVSNGLVSGLLSLLLNSVHGTYKYKYMYIMKTYYYMYAVFAHLHSVQVWVSVDPVYCSDRSAEYNRQLWLSGGPAQLQRLLWHGPRGVSGGGDSSRVIDLLQSPEPGGLESVRPLRGWCHIDIPGKCI